MNKAIIFDWIGTLYKRNIGLFLESENILKTAKEKGYKIGLVSLAGQGIENRKKDIKKSGIESYFDFISIALKKDEKVFRNCINKLKSSPQNTLIVGDRMLREIKIGNKLNCKTCWIQKGDYSNEKPNKNTGKPDYIFDFIGGLLEII